MSEKASILDIETGRLNQDLLPFTEFIDTVQKQTDLLEIIPDQDKARSIRESLNWVLDTNPTAARVLQRAIHETESY